MQPPPWWRVLPAFAVAPAAAAAAFSCVSPLYEGLPDIFERIWRTFPVVAVVGGYLPTFLIGFPAYVVLRRRVRPTMRNCVCVAAGVAALPWLLMTLLPTAGEASLDDGRATVANGHVTWFGLWEGLQLSAMVAVFGGLGGLTFWLVAAAGSSQRRG